jgi:hypothetical protein
MPRTLALLPFLLVAAACSGPEGDGLSKDVSELRTELSRVQKENRELAARLEAQERRLGGLAEDVALVGRDSTGGKPAGDPAAGETVDVSAGMATPGAAPVHVDGAAIKAYFSTEEGQKVFAELDEAMRASRSREQNKRMVESAVDRFARTAQLTEEQTRRMKELMTKQVEAMRDLYAPMRELPRDATAQQRDEARQAINGKAEEVRKQTDDSVRALLSQTQYEQFEQEQDRLRAGFGGLGALGGGGNRRNRDRGNGGGNGGRQGGN